MTAHLVGVLGGVGPGATAYFLQRLVDRTQATCDQEHIRSLAFNDTAIPDRTAFLLGETDQSPIDIFVKDGQLLQTCGCDLLALPCNTAHCFFDEVQERLHTPIVHMVRETVGHVRDEGFRQAGVLATLGTVTSGVYAAECERAGVTCVYPDVSVQQMVNRTIFDDVKAGRVVEPALLAVFAQAMANQGCDCVVLGCTELSFAFGKTPVRTAIPVIDALDVLADCIIERTGHARKEAGLCAGL